MAFDKEKFYSDLYNDLTKIDINEIEKNFSESNINPIQEAKESPKSFFVTSETLKDSLEDDIGKRILNSLQENKKLSKSKDSNILGADIPELRKVQFGMRQEPTIAGSLFRLGKAGVTSLFSDKTFNEAAREIEKERQKKIFQDFPEFYGKKEDLTVLGGRMGVALADPVTFFIPWVKVAKAGKAATIATGAGIAAGETALREKTLYGDIDANMVALSTVLGAGATGISDVIARKIRSGKAKDKVVTVDKNGKPVVMETTNTDPVVPLNISKNVQKALEEISDESFKISQPYIAKFSDNLETLGVKYSKRNKIGEQLEKAIKEKKAIIKNSKQKEFDFMAEPTRLDLEINKLKDSYKKNQAEINDILISQQPEQIAITGFNSFKAAHERGLLKGAVGENLVRAFVHEMVRPIFGGIGGAATGLYLAEEETEQAMMGGLMAGVALGIFNKRLENYKPKIILSNRIKNAFQEESEKIFKRSFRSWTKRMLSGTHAAKLQSEANPVLTEFGEDLLGTRGSAFDFGKPLTNSVEELKDTTIDYFRKQLYDITGELDDETLEAAGRIVQQSNINRRMKYNFATQADLDNAKAVETADKLLKLNKSISDYAKKAGLEFTELESYGLTQILDNGMVDEIGFENAVKIIAKSFQIQNRNKIKRGFKEKELTDKAATSRAISYLNKSDDIRRVEIMETEQAEGDIEKIILSLLDSSGNNILKKNKTLMQSARFLENKRILVDPEARAYAKDLFIQQPEFTILRLIENTVPVAEFARRYGAKGEGLTDIISNIRKFYNGFGDIKKNSSLQSLVKEDIQTVKDTVNAYFGVYGVNSKRNNHDYARSIALTLQTLLSVTKLTRVAIPSLGDLVQTINNSGYSAAANSALRQLRKTSENPSAMLAQRSANIKEGIFGRKWSDRTYRGTLERELSDFNLQATTNYQKFLIKFQQQFFEKIQLGRVTRFAREFAYDAGAFRAFDLGQIAAKGKFPRKNIRELNSLGMSVDNAKYLGKFKSMDEAYADTVGKQIIDIAGRKAANRDALIPQIGNRRLFSQSKDPLIKFAGSFLSWAQAKATQTNSLIRRIEDGDGKLAVMMLATIPLYAGVRQLQVNLNPTLSVRDEFPNPLEDGEQLSKFLGETVIFSGQVIPWYIDKILGFVKYNRNDAIETLYPAVGFLQDLLGGIAEAAVGPNRTSGVLRVGETLVPFGKDITRRESVGKFIGLDESIKDTAKGVDTEQTSRARFTTGGGNIKGVMDVPFTKENPADRINPYTGEPYSGLVVEDFPLLNRMPMDEGGLTDEQKSIIDEEIRRLGGVRSGELQSRAPVIELLVSGVPRIIAGVGRQGYKLIDELSKNSKRAPKPLRYYHGSTLKLKEVTPMADRVDPKLQNMFQAASYLGKPTEGGLDIANYYARGGGFVNIIDEKVFNKIVKNLYNPRNISDDVLKNINKEITTRKNLIDFAKRTNTRKNLGKFRKELIDLENLVKPYGSGYISKVSPVQRKVLRREGFDGIDISDDVIAVFDKLPVRRAARGSLTDKLLKRRQKKFTGGAENLVEDTVLDMVKDKSWFKRATEPEGELYKGKHTLLTTSSEVDGKEYLFPTIREVNGKLKKLSNQAALKEAMRKKDFLVFEGKNKEERIAKATEVSKIISNLVMPTRENRMKKFTGGKETDNSLRYKKIFNELPESLKQDKHIINVDGSDYVVDKKVTAEDFKKRLSDFGTPQAYISGLEAKMKRLLEKEEGPLEKVGRDATNFLSFLTNALNPRTTINDIRYINAPYFSEREKEMLKDYKKSKEK